MRDSERQKSYDAESNWARAEGDLGIISIDEATDIIDLLAQDFEIRQPRVIHVPQMRRWDGLYHARGHRIEFRTDSPSLKTVLHEFAHALAHSRRFPVGRSHGGRFTEAMLDTVRVHFGDGRERNLRRHYLNVGLVTSAKEERTHEMKISARQQREEDRVGEEAPLWIVSYRMQDDRVWFVGRGKYLDRDRDGVKVYRRMWAAYQKADKFQEGLCEVHQIDGIFSPPEWDGHGYPGETPRWLPINEDICDEVAAQRERQIIAQKEVEDQEA